MFYASSRPTAPTCSITRFLSSSLHSVDCALYCMSLRMRRRNRCYVNKACRSTVWSVGKGHRSSSACSKQARKLLHDDWTHEKRTGNRACTSSSGCTGAAVGAERPAAPRRTASARSAPPVTGPLNAQPRRPRRSG